MGTLSSVFDNYLLLEAYKKEDVVRWGGLSFLVIEAGQILKLVRSHSLTLVLFFLYPVSLFFMQYDFSYKDESGSLSQRYLCLVPHINSVSIPDSFSLRIFKLLNCSCCSF